MEIGGATLLQDVGDDTECALSNSSAQPVRKSCNRCYVQKIKCTRSTRSPTQCQRCERAGLKCVFGRRNPRQPAKAKASVPTMLSRRSSEDDGNQPYHSIMRARGRSNSSGTFSLDWLGSLDRSEVCSQPSWPWQDLSENSNWVFPDVSDQSSCSTAIVSSQFPAEERPDATTSGGQGVFERLCLISTTLENCVRSLTSHEKLENVQSFPIGNVFGAFQEFLKILRSQTPGRKLTMLEGFQQTKTNLLASHCYMVCLKTMEALADSLCREVPVQQRQSGTWQSPPRDIPRPGFKSNLLVNESFSHLHPLASYLMSACTTLQTGVKILSEIEVEFGVPQGSGIGGTNTTPTPPSTAEDGAEKLDYRGFSQVFRLLETMKDGDGSCSEVSTTLQNFRRDHAKIVRLTRQHIPSFLALSFST
ncbi:hypothetical protein F5Y12DRAFT_762512 [Xylaria sp. FL1777]|nr:hypothetical protein F5Y12DRAFT_762512 [Xylaria sp. FL1777]